jgi:surface antigen
MKRYARTALLLCALLFVVTTLLLIYNHLQVGKVLDSYRGVPVYDNGVLYFRGYGKHYGQDGYYYGQKWQCVEFVKRFYHDAKQHSMPDGMGHAKSFFDQSLPDDVVNPRRGLVQYRNGSSHGPQPDDLMVFTDTKYGHVGIVTRATSDSVEIVQQNVLTGSRRRLSLTVSNGHYFVTAPRQPAGWLRKEDAQRGRRT